jgi:hypothetical protein
VHGLIARGPGVSGEILFWRYTCEEGKRVVSQKLLLEDQDWIVAGRWERKVLEGVYNEEEDFDLLR